MKTARQLKAWKDVKSLDEFNKTHMRTFELAGASALGLREDPTRVQDYYVSIWVRLRPDARSLSRRPSRAYWVCAADVVSYDSLHPEVAKQLKNHLRSYNDREAKRECLAWSLVSMLPEHLKKRHVNVSFLTQVVCVETGSTTLNPAKLILDTGGPNPLPPKEMWKEWMQKRINDGVDDGEYNQNLISIERS
jgi:hypothetical protein